MLLIRCPGGHSPPPPQCTATAFCGIKHPAPPSLRQRMTVAAINAAMVAKSSANRVAATATRAVRKGPPLQQAGGRAAVGGRAAGRSEGMPSAAAASHVMQ